MRVRTRLLTLAALVAVVSSGCSSNDPSSNWRGHEKASDPATATAAPSVTATGTSTQPGAVPSQTQTTVPEGVAVKIGTTVIPAYTEKMGAGWEWKGAGSPNHPGQAGEFAQHLFRESAQVTWNYFSTQAGLPAKYSKYWTASVAVRTRCAPDKPKNGELGSVPTDYPKLFYCSLGSEHVLGTAFVPVATFHSSVWGDAAIPAEQRNLVGAMVIGDLYTYHVMRQVELHFKLPTLPRSHARVIGACLTGIWMQAAYPADTILTTDKTDLTPAVKAGLRKIDAIVGLPLDPEEPNQPIERLEAAFRIGVITARPVVCGQFWPGTAWS